jgi:hypothetical protein
MWRISGSVPRKPTRMTLFTLPAVSLLRLFFRIDPMKLGAHRFQGVHVRMSFLLRSGDGDAASARRYPQSSKDVSRPHAC